MEFVDVIWLGAGNFGIVKVEDEYEGIKFYGGATVPGNTPEQDIERIMDWGSTISPDALEKFLTR